LPGHFLIRAEQPLGLDIKPSVAQPRTDLTWLPAVDVKVHGMTAVTLCL